VATFVDFYEELYELPTVGHHSMGCFGALIRRKIPADVQETLEPSIAEGQLWRTVKQGVIRNHRPKRVYASNSMSHTGKT
jgi:hypothetical protein